MRNRNALRRRPGESQDPLPQGGVVGRSGNCESSPNTILGVWVLDQRSLCSLVQDDELILTLPPPHRRRPGARSEHGTHNHREWLWRELATQNPRDHTRLWLWIPDLRSACPGRQW
ncbi:hypothetical protein EI171_02300 [Bradyrhizobium sp. LCT2]|nr:hypothetical protein EI171_02300 [Bradyrhizobium sp. LCT2]